MLSSIILAGVLEIVGQGSSQIAFNWWLRSAVVNNLSVVFISDIFIALLFLIIAFFVIGRLVAKWNQVLSGRISQINRFIARGSAAAAAAQSSASTTRQSVVSSSTQQHAGSVISLQHRNSAAASPLLPQQQQPTGTNYGSAAPAGGEETDRNKDKNNNSDHDDDDDAAASPSCQQQKQQSDTGSQHSGAAADSNTDSNSNKHFTGEAPDVSLTLDEICYIVKAIFLSDRVTVAWLVLAGLCDCMLSLSETYAAGHILVITQLFLRACEPVLTWLFAQKWRRLENPFSGGGGGGGNRGASSSSDTVTIVSGSRWRFATGGGSPSINNTTNSDDRFHLYQSHAAEGNNEGRTVGGDEQNLQRSASSASSFLSGVCPSCSLPNNNRVTLSVIALLCVALGIGCHFALEIKNELSSDASSSSSGNTNSSSGTTTTTVAPSLSSSTHQHGSTNKHHKKKALEEPIGFIFLYALSVVGSALYAISFGRYIFLVRRLALHIDPLDLVDLHRGLEHDRVTEHVVGDVDRMSEGGGMLSSASAAGGIDGDGNSVPHIGGGGAGVGVADDPQLCYGQKRRSSLNSADGFGWDATDVVVESPQSRRRGGGATQATSSSAVSPQLRILDRRRRGEGDEEEYNNTNNADDGGNNINAQNASFATSTAERHERLHQTLKVAHPDSVAAREALAALERARRRGGGGNANNNNNIVSISSSSSPTGGGGGGGGQQDLSSSTSYSPSAGDVRMVACALETTICLLFSLVIAPSFEFLPSGMGTATSWSNLCDETHQAILALTKTDVLFPCLVTLVGWSAVYGADSVLNHLSAPVGSLINQLTTPLTAIVLLCFPVLDPTGNPSAKVPESVAVQVTLKVLSVVMIFTGSVLMFLAESTR